MDAHTITPGSFRFDEPPPSFRGAKLAQIDEVDLSRGERARNDGRGEKSIRHTPASLAPADARP
jgi:hypothetical protein